MRVSIILHIGIMMTVLIVGHLTTIWIPDIVYTIRVCEYLLPHHIYVSNSHIQTHNSIINNNIFYYCVNIQHAHKHSKITNHGIHLRSLSLSHRIHLYTIPFPVCLPQIYIYIFVLRMNTGIDILLSVCRRYCILYIRQGI